MRGYDRLRLKYVGHTVAQTVFYPSFSNKLEADEIILLILLIDSASGEPDLDEAMSNI